MTPRATAIAASLLVLQAALVGCAVAVDHTPAERAPAPRDEALARVVASRGVSAQRTADGAVELDVLGFALRVRGGGELALSALGVGQAVPLSRGAATLALELPPGARLTQPAGFPRVVELVDAEGATRGRVRSDDASLRLRARGAELRIEWAGEGTAAPPIALVDWTATSAPLAIRDHHTATLLPTGDVLFAGGFIASTPTATTEIYDGTSGRFRAGSSLLSARAEHTATMRDDGRVMILGGKGVAGTLASSELFDALDGTFVPGPSLLKARHAHSATRLVDGRIFVVGGDDHLSAEALDASGTAFSSLPPANSATYGTAASFADGRVLVASNPLQIFDPTTDTFSDGPSLDLAFADMTATRTPFGDRIVLSGMCGTTFGCSTSPGSSFGVVQPDLTISTADSPSAGFYGAASMLPSGEVLVTGGTIVPFVASGTSNAHAHAAAFDVFLAELTPVPDMGVVRQYHTSTLLPSGSTLIVGGAASVDLFLRREVGQLPFGIAVGVMLAPRADFAAVTLLDGTSFVSGGRNDASGCLATSERLVNVTLSASMHHPRTLHTLTLLDDGRVLAAGGACDGSTEAEVYDRTTDAWTLSGTPSRARSGHTATLLFDGRVLIAGGSDPAGPTASTELWSPTTGAFTAGPTDPSVNGAHAATILPSGRVLLLAKDRAGVFDPTTDTFVVSKSIGAEYDFPSATLLPSGKVLIAGKLSPNGLVYDDSTGGFSFTGPAVEPFDHHEAILLPSGRVALIGGLTPPIEITGSASVQLFDPLAEGGIGGFLAGKQLFSGGRGNHRLLLSLNGDVLVIGGEVCQSAGCPKFQLDTYETYREPSDFNRPMLTTVPATVVPGVDSLVAGDNFRGSAASSGNTRASDGGYPIAIWQSVLYGGRAIGAFHDVDAMGASWRPPSTPFRGPGLLRVSTNASLSVAQPVTISAAADGHTCSGGHECTSGVCADGYCCATVCDGLCRSCSGIENGTNVFGVCNDIPPALSVDDACVIGKGGGCASDDDCSTGFCVDSVCCESACDQQCEACDVDGNQGNCTAVAGPPHGARPACDTAPDTCDNAICDGVQRQTCEAVVGPCAPYRCGVTACETSCDPTLGPNGGACALDFRCTPDGLCVPRLASCKQGNIAVSRDGVETNCSPYNCQADGSCREACGSVLDCTDPFVCDPSGHCVARGADTVDEGCAVGLITTGGGARGGGVPGEPIAALALTVLLLRRIRARSGGRRLAR